MTPPPASRVAAEPDQMVLVGGHTDFGGGHPSEVLTHVKAGRLRLLATFAAQRSKRWPTVPTLKELGFPIVAMSPYGLGGPHAIAVVLEELQSGANCAFNMYPGLTHGAADVISSFGTDHDVYTRYFFNANSTFFQNFAGQHTFKAGVRYERFANDVLSGLTKPQVTIYWDQDYMGSRGRYGYYELVQIAPNKWKVVPR